MGTQYKEIERRDIENGNKTIAITNTLAIGKYRNTQYIRIAEFFTNSAGKLIPSGKGVNFSINSRDKIAKAMMDLKLPRESDKVIDTMRDKKDTKEIYDLKQMMAQQQEQIEKQSELMAQLLKKKGK